jgi:hypothetical protein
MAKKGVSGIVREEIRLTPEGTHNVVKRALLGVAGLFQRIGEMKAHVAVSGFRKRESRPLGRTRDDQKKETG